MLIVSGTVRLQHARNFFVAAIPLNVSTVYSLHIVGRNGSLRFLSLFLTSLLLFDVNEIIWNRKLIEWVSEWLSIAKRPLALSTPTSPSFSYVIVNAQ